MNTPSTPTLRRVLQANAVSSATSGLFFLVLRTPLAEFLGVDPMVITELMFVMFAYAALITYFNSRPVLSRGFVLFTVFGDSAWVLLSIALLTFNWLPFSVEAKWAIGIIALVVDLFATLQFLGWRKMNAAQV
jgi:hypothetical protein